MRLIASLLALACATVGPAGAQPDPGPSVRDAGGSPADHAARQPDERAPEPSAETAAREDGPARTRRYGFFSGTYRPGRPPQWTIELEPSVWYAAPNGEIEFPGGGFVEGDVVNVDSPGLSPRLETHLRIGRVTVTASGSLIEASGDAVLVDPITIGATTFASGDRLASKLRLDTAALFAGYRVAEFGGRPDDTGLSRFYTRMDVIGGLRYYDFGFSATTQTGAPRRVSAAIRHVEPLIGFRYAVEFDRRLHAEAEVNFGWTPEIDGQGSRSGSVQVSVNYRPQPWWGVQVGYQLRTTDLYNDDAEFSGGVAGLFGGLTVRF
ncbi:MAG: hypothetical protein ACTS22_06985 [Phycisphaerales bacterium]